jgi:hypothetical protein
MRGCSGRGVALISDPRQFSLARSLASCPSQAFLVIGLTTHQTYYDESDRKTTLVTVIIKFHRRRPVRPAIMAF